MLTLGRSGRCAMRTLTARTCCIGHVLGASAAALYTTRVFRQMTVYDERQLCFAMALSTPLCTAASVVTPPRARISMPSKVARRRQHSQTPSLGTDSPESHPVTIASTLPLPPLLGPLVDRVTQLLQTFVQPTYIESDASPGKSAHKPPAFTLDDQALNRLTNTYHYYVMLRRINQLRRHASLQLGQRVIDRMRQQEVEFSYSSQFNQLVWFFSTHRMLPSLWSTFLEMRRRGIPANVVTYNHIINAFGEYDFEIARDLLLQLHFDSLLPNTITYNVLLRQLATRGQFDEMMKLYQLMLGDGAGSADGINHPCPPSVYTYTTLMHAAAAAGRSDIVSAFRTLLQTNAQENVVSYTVLINAILVTPTESGTPELGRERGPSSPELIQQRSQILLRDRSLLEEMHEKQIRPNAITYTSLMTRAFRGNDRNMALAYYAELIAQNAHPDIVAYGALIFGLSRLGRFSEAEKIRQEMCNSIDTSGIKFNTIVAHSKSLQKQYVAASEILLPFLRAGQMDAIAIVTLMHSYVRMRRLDLALRIWKRIFRLYGARESAKVRDPILFAFARRGQTRALQWLFQQSLRGEHPTRIPLKTLFHALIVSYAQRRLANKALHLWRQFRSLGQPLSPSMLSVLINACGRSRDAVSLDSLRADLEADDLTMNPVHLSAYIVALARVGDAKRCRATLNAALRNNIWLKYWVLSACHASGVYVDDIYTLYSSPRLLRNQPPTLTSDNIDDNAH